MELFFCKCVFLVLVLCLFIFSIGCSAAGLPGNSRVRGVNLGGWLVIEGWIKPSLFDDIPNGDMLDGTEIQLKSVTLQKYVSAENGGGAKVTVDRDTPQSWETFRQLWRVSESIFQFRTSEGQFLTCSGDGDNINAVAKLPSGTETFYLERNNDNRVHIKLKTGTYIQASKDNQLTADYPGTPGWDDNAATFELIIVSNNIHGDYQLANGYGHDAAEKVLKEHRNNFITRQDFNFLYMHGINTVRIPVGWWVAYDPSPPPPYIGGSLEALDNAFSWAQTFGIKCIIDLHAAPGSQNGMEHSASRDGFTGWAKPDYISKTLEVIDFLASRYAKHPALLGIELLNEPSAATVPLDILVSFYKEGYQTVRKYTSTAYVIFCQRIGNADPYELYQANLGTVNTVIDLHYYNLFDTFFANMSSLDNIQFLYKNRQAQIQALNDANGPLVFIGEWVNEWFVNNGSQIDYQDFGRAQLDIYNAASFGWAYWTLKNDRKHWDFEWNILNNYIQLQQARFLWCVDRF
ncbi:probable glucan 1,3-beta-glucosidase A isoform X3 [Henckelia pumila]|uniref:probable glucan 1,3-beta-glucosidase A isoform X3 n=1 Tax=Henckelia pumila TaxID=405737 RepID=UPI003C6E125D